MDGSFSRYEEDSGSYLPPSSTDLPVPAASILSLVSVYKVLTELHGFGHLTFEDVCAAVANRDSCGILSDIYIALLDGLLAEEIPGLTGFEILSLEKLDEVTWPCALRLYLSRKEKSSAFSGDYYSLDVEKRVQILKLLTKSHSAGDNQIYGTVPLSRDSRGTVYWFTQRRLIAHAPHAGTFYYSDKEKLDAVLSQITLSDSIDSEVLTKLKDGYYDYVEQMNETLIDIVYLFKTSQARNLQSPTKYSGITYGEKAAGTIFARKDIENMPMSSLASHARLAHAEGFSFGSDKLFLKYRSRVTGDALAAALSNHVRGLKRSVREQLLWKSNTSDQVKLLRTTLLSMASKIPRYFMHDAWARRESSWETAVGKAGNAHHLAACLAFLESHIRPVVFTSEWTKIHEDTTRITAKEANKDVSKQEEKTEKEGEDDEMKEEEEIIPPPADEIMDTSEPSEARTPSKRKGSPSKAEESSWSYMSTHPSCSSSILSDKLRGCERLTRIVNKIQCTKGNVQSKRVISMPHGFRKIVGADGKVMFALPAGARIIPQKNVTKVIMSADSLKCGLPTALRVIPSDQNKENTVPGSVKEEQGNIVLSKEVVQSLLKRSDVAVKGNVTLKRRAVRSLDDPAELLQRLFQSWGTQPPTDNRSIPEYRQRKLGRVGGRSQLPGYLYDTPADFCVANSHNLWRKSLRTSQDIADIATLVSMLHSHVMWAELEGLELLTNNNYKCGDDNLVQRIIVDSRFDKDNELVKQFKIVVMKQKVEGEEVLEIASSAIQQEMQLLDIGVHDLWVTEDKVTFSESYTYQFNQEKLKNIESARLQEEKRKKEAEQVESELLLPSWQEDDAGPDKKYFVDSEISAVVRRVLTNVLDRVEMEDMRDRERSRKRRKKKKSLGRVSGKSTDERDQIRYFGKLDILLGRRKEQLKRTFFKKRQYLAHKIREDIQFEEAEGRRIADKIRREEEHELSERRRKGQEADKAKREKEKKIRKAQDKIEKKLQRLQKNVDDLKESAVKKYRSPGRPPKSPARTPKSPGRPPKSPARTPKSPGRPTKSPKPKKSSIRIEPHLLKPVYKNKLQPKSKFKFPPKRPVVKKTAKMSLTPSHRGSLTPTHRGSLTPSHRGSLTPSHRGSVTPSHRSRPPSSSEKVSIRTTSTEKPAPRDVEKILGKRRARPLSKKASKRLCVEIVPVRLSKRKREALEVRLNRYQRNIARSLTSDDLSHPVIDIAGISVGKRRPSLKLKTKSPSSLSTHDTIRERLQKLRKLASAKNGGNEVLAKLFKKQELVKKLAATHKDGKAPPEPVKKAIMQKASTRPPVARAPASGPAPSASIPGIAVGGPPGSGPSGVLQSHKDQTNKSAPQKKDTLYCICKRPYDHTRFYIGCDVCSNWYHGKCVAISPSMARNMSGYTCESCKTKEAASAPAPVEVEKPAEPEGDLFCICRTPYNQYSFYIGCDNCQEWYHGTCVGISEMEAEKIEVYICDRCKQQQGREEPKLTHIQIAGLIKILRELQMHKMSWPFREPSKSDSDDVIKEPMDLSTIHKKFQKKHYPKLTLFVKDVLRVFSNARQMYSEDSQRGRCADTLERYFVAKLNEFKLRHGLS